MVRLWRASFRRNQWNRIFGYKSAISFKAAGVSVVVWVTILSFVCFAAKQLSNAPPRDQFYKYQQISPSFGNRHLLETNSKIIYDGKCNPKNASLTSAAHGPVWEQCDVEKSTNLSGLFIFLYILLTVIIFIAVAIVCDDFFVPTLEAISEKLELSEDVAGATFMAAGSSAPELFSSIAGVAFNSDVGVGTITGSAVFNLLVIIALTAAFSGKILNLDWRPLIRDSCFYAISIAWLIYSAWDTFFQVWEAAIMLLLYIIYIGLMFINERLMNFMSKLACKCCCTSVEPADTEQGDVAMETVRSESHSNLNGVANNAQCTRGSVDSRRMSTTSHNSLSGQDTKIFRHDRRNSVLLTLASSRPSLKGDEKLGAGGKRGSILPGDSRPSLSKQSSQDITNPEMRSDRNDTSNDSSCQTPSESLHNRPPLASRSQSMPTGTSARLPPLKNPNVGSLSGMRGSSILPPISSDPENMEGEDNAFMSSTDNSDTGPLWKEDTHNLKANMDTLKEEISNGSDEDEKGSEKVRKSSASPEAMGSIKEGKDEEMSDEQDRVDEEDEDEEEEEEEEPHIDCCCACCPAIRGAPPPKPSEEEKTCTTSAVYVLKWIVFVLAFPFIVLFSMTIPDCSKENHRTTCWIISGFLLSVLWIAGLSFGMVTLVARTGCLIGVDSFVMSLVVLAAGTSIPDLLSSIIVARDGYGDMAVSNAIGSNVFDIDLGLGLPFLIRIIGELGEPFDIMSQTERNAYCTGKMVFKPHPKFGFILLGLLVVANIVFAISKYRLNKLIGISFFLMYLGFLVYAFIQEFLCSKPETFHC